MLANSRVRLSVENLWGRGLFRLLLGAVFMFAGVIGQASAAASKAEFQLELRDRLLREADTDVVSQQLAEFYAARQFRPVWLNTPIVPNARVLLAALDSADREGLDPRRYGGEAMLRDCILAVSTDRMDCELRLSRALLSYIRDVRFGQAPAQLMDDNWHIDPADQDVLALMNTLTEVETAASVLKSLPPSQPAYQALRLLLAEYRWLQSLGGWPQIGEGPILRPSMVDDRVPLLRERLALTDGADLSAGRDLRFDKNLQQAVRHFQHRHGLKADAVVGPKTLAALNVPIEHRIAQLRVNLERWRWMPREMPERYVAVNIPGFELSLVENGLPELRMRAIAGKSKRSSPVLHTRIKGIVFNPDWTVPMTIAIEDFLPKLQRDAGYLEKKNIQVLKYNGVEFVEVDPRQVEWRRYHKDHFPFVLRQTPGNHNSLGRVKFDMPNKFDVYVHDTPGKSLFDKDIRAFSSGCIRVERPLALAQKLLDGESPIAVRNYVRSRIAVGATNDMVLNPGVDIFLLYFTAWVDERGTLHFRDDVYNRNVKLHEWFDVL